MSERGHPEKAKLKMGRQIVLDLMFISIYLS